jgi:hypothetical protein
MATSRIGRRPARRALSLAATVAVLATGLSGTAAADAQSTSAHRDRDFFAVPAAATVAEIGRILTIERDRLCRGSTILAIGLRYCAT